MKRGVTIHHNGPWVRIGVDDPHDRCVAFWRAVKHYHVVTKGWSDIAYSFGVCMHGQLLEGRGWGRNQFANGEDIVGPENGSDSEWYSIFVLLGWNADNEDPVDQEPSPAMIAGVRATIRYGRAKGHCGGQVLPHNAFKPKRCPGATFTTLANQWHNQPLDTGLPPAPDPIGDDDMQWFLVKGKTRGDYWLTNWIGRVPLGGTPQATKEQKDQHKANLRFFGVIDVNRGLDSQGNSLPVEQAAIDSMPRLDRT